MRKSIHIPGLSADIYPNPIVEVHGTPAVVFRDHRWTLPLIFLAQNEGILDRPSKVVSFDRHKDSLEPSSIEKLSSIDLEKTNLHKLVEIVSNLSPRDEDWIRAGMELGLISDVMQFGSLEADKIHETTTHTDSYGKSHKIFHLGRPRNELSHKGALADRNHPSTMDGMWELLGWCPSLTNAGIGGKYLFDIDLDFFTYEWYRYVFPYNEEIYQGEFLTPGSSPYGETIPAEFVRGLTSNAGLVTIAAEPHFCGGTSKTNAIFKDINNILFEGSIPEGIIKLDYHRVYLVEE